jgi:hypothetical protein
MAAKGVNQSEVVVECLAMNQITCEAQLFQKNNLKIKTDIFLLAQKESSFDRYIPKIPKYKKYSIFTQHLEQTIHTVYSINLT